MKLSKIIKEMQPSINSKDSSVDNVKKDPSELLWNVFKIHATDVGLNGYTATLTPETQVLSRLITSAMYLKHKGKFVGSSSESTSGDGYMYQYIIGLSDTMQNDTKAMKGKFTIEKVNDAPMSKAKAEDLKRKTYKSDPESFKNKGASLSKVGGKHEPAKPIEVPGAKNVGNLRTVIEQMFKNDELQYYPEDQTLVYYPDTLQQILDSNLPEALKLELQDINKNRSFKIRDKKEFDYGLRRIPSTYKVFNTILALTPDKYKK